MTNPIYDPYAVLQKVYGGGAFLKQALTDTPIEELNRARTVKICYGVLENDLYLDFCIRSFAPKNPKLPVRIILKICLYMLLFLKKQRYMITDNAVSLAKKLGKGGASGFINAFLRTFDAEKLKFPQEKTERLSVQYSYPVFAVKRLLAEYGDDAVSVMEHMPARTFVRFKNKETAEKYLNASAHTYENKEDVHKGGEQRSGAEKTPFENVYAFSNFRRDKGFDAGEYTFQSVGSAAICSVVEPCENLLDACAAPGGKSVLLSEKCAHVTAFELHAHRAELIRSYAARMGAKNIDVVCRDSSVYDEKYRRAFDAVLVDAPCSGYGVTNENPDIRFFRKEESLQELHKIQLSILNACAEYVREGGKLYYSTCSVFGEENDGTIAEFLKTHPEFCAEKIVCALGHMQKKYGLQFLPHLSMGAGFYVSKLVRKTEKLLPVE